MLSISPSLCLSLRSMGGEKEFTSERGHPFLPCVRLFLDVWC